MPIINWDDDFTTGLIPTDDPRVFGVIRRDDYAEAPDGDVYAPTYWLDASHGWRFEQAGSTFTDDAVMERIIEARERRVGRNYDGLIRYARIFLGTTFELVSSHVHRDYQVLILNTPAWREYVGLDADDLSEPETADWQAFLDGDVYGVATYVDMARTQHDAPLPDHDDAWLEAEDACHGYFGETYAAQEAVSQASWYIENAVHPMLPIGD